MSKKIFFAAAAALLAFAQGAEAQTNVQTFYDFGSDRGHFTTTIEGFYGDKWGNTFFFVDHDFNTRDAAQKVYAPNGTYMEIARCLNFWQKTKLSGLSLQVEYNGGVYNGFTINNAFLAGIDYFIHSKDFRNTFNFKVLYKYINYAKAVDLAGNLRSSQVPLQFTFVWGMQDLFGLKGLRFSGFADFWWESHTVYPFANGRDVNFRDWAQPETSQLVFLTEPQIWYNVGRHFGVENLNVGGEIEMSYDFGTGKGFFVRPCTGLKWVF